MKKYIFFLFKNLNKIFNLIYKSQFFCLFKIKNYNIKVINLKNNFIK